MSKKLFIFLMCTNGILWSLISCIVYLAMVLTGHKPKYYGYSVYFEVGDNRWGGLELGWVYLVNREPREYIIAHEAGHSIQMAMFGILYLPLGIYSVIRYWYFRIVIKYFPKKELPPYDSLWFEGWATSIGRKFNQ